jgi:hypothetical protein
MTDYRPIAPLFDGPVDVIGDVHGEIDALRALLRHLGYDREGQHLQGRRVVFIGDLVDRGPDSPAVVELVRERVARGRAQCVLGNHELNLLRAASKPGNRWFMDPAHAEQQPGGHFALSRVASAEFRRAALEFFATLPLALERRDFRRQSVVSLYRRFERRTVRELDMEGLSAASERELQQWGAQLEDRGAEVPLLTATGECDERYQMGNPVRVITSGVERMTTQPFFSSGKWRMCDRVKWWEQYTDPVPVIVGHYWRRLSGNWSDGHAASKPDLFEGLAVTGWMGPRENVFCVDYSIGARYEERRAGRSDHHTRLAALRWPEKQVVFEDGVAR